MSSSLAHRVPHVNARSVSDSLDDGDAMFGGIAFDLSYFGVDERAVPETLQQMEIPTGTPIQVQRRARYALHGAEFLPPDI